ncbi:unnamed protein product, partial [Rotaria sordida]
ETIGDAYMLVSGLPERAQNHATEIIDMAFDMLDAIITVSNPINNEKFKIRIGCHSGQVVAGIAGIKMPRYCLFGDAVSKANIIEQTSEVLHIHISDETYKLLDQKLYVFEEHSKMTKNGSLLMNTYFVLNKKDRSENIQIGPFHHVFEEMKRQEIEETKLKQTTIVKSAKIDDSLPLTSKSNGFLQSLSASNSISRLAGSVELTVSNKINNNHIISHLAENSITNPRIDNNQSSKMHETTNEPRQSIKSFQGRLRSRTCELL